MAAFSLASLWTCSPWKLPGVTADSSLSPCNPALLDWNILPQSPFITWLSYHHVDSLPSPFGISFPSFLWISACVLLQHTHTYTHTLSHTHTHSHLHTHTLSVTHSRFSSERLITPPAHLSFTMSQQYFHVPYFDLHHFSFATRSLQLHKWLSRVNASNRWTITFLRSFSDSSAWFTHLAK